MVKGSYDTILDCCIEHFSVYKCSVTLLCCKLWGHKGDVSVGHIMGRTTTTTVYGHYIMKDSFNVIKK